MKHRKNINRHLFASPLFLLTFFIGLFLFSQNAAAALNYGTPASFSGNSQYYDICRLDDNHVAIAYRNNASSDGRVKVGTISDTGLSWSVDAQFTTSDITDVSIACLSSSNFVVAYDDYTNSKSYAKVGTVTGSWTIDGSGWGTQAEFYAGNTNSNTIQLAALSSNKIALAYGYGGSQYGAAKIGTIDEYKAITFGSEGLYVTGSEHNDIAALSSSKFVIAYHDTNTSKATAVAATVDGTAITYGSVKAIDNLNNSAGTSIEKLSDSSFVIAYDGSTGMVIYGTVDGTTLNFGSAAPISSGTYGASGTAIAGMSANTFVALYNDGDNLGYGTSKIGTINGNQIASLSNSVIFDSSNSVSSLKSINIGSDKHVALYYFEATGAAYGVVGAYTKKTFNLGNIRSVVIDQVSNYLAVVSVNNGASIDLVWQDLNGAHPIPNVRTGTNLALMGGAGVVQDPLDATRIYFGYTSTSSPTEDHVVHYDLDDETLISDTALTTAGNFNATVARETYANKPIIFYAIGSQGYIYIGGSSYAITGASIAEAPLAVTSDGSNIYIAYQDAANLDLMAASFAIGSPAVTPVTIDALDTVVIDLEAAGIRNSKIEVVYLTLDLALKSASSADGSTYTATTQETLEVATEISALELSSDPTKAVVVYYDGTNLVQREITMTTGASTKTTIQSGADIYLSPTVNESSTDLVYAYGEEGTSTDNLFALTEGGTPINLNQEENGESIPELPANIIWKVVIALMSMGAVITIAAVLRKKGIKSVKAKTKTTVSKKAVKAVRTRKTGAKSGKK